MKRSRILEDRDDWHVAQLLAALEKANLQDEKVAQELAAELPDQVSSRCCRPACFDEKKVSLGAPISRIARLSDFATA